MILQEGARRLLAQAVEAEAEAFLASMRNVRLPDGRDRLVRHGHGPERVMQTGIGPVAVRRVKLRDRDAGESGERVRFTSAILPRWSRRTRSLDALLPILYLRGVSAGDFQEALAALLGKDAPNLSSSVIARLKAEWEAEYARWQRRELSARRYVYIWVDGVYLQARMEPQAECMLVVIGATPEGKKERKPFSGLLTADNAAYRLTGPQEALLVLDANSFTELGEKTELSYYRSAGNTQNFGQASSEFFVGSSGLRMRVHGGYGVSIPSGFLRAIDYNGRTTVAGLSVSYPVIRRRQQTLSLSAYFDAIESRISTNAGVAEAAFVPSTLNASNNSLRLGADYARQDLLLGGDRSAINAVTFRLSQGLPILGPSSSPGVGSRAGERIDFFKAFLEFSRTETLFEPWAGRTWPWSGPPPVKRPGAFCPGGEVLSRRPALQSGLLFRGSHGR